MNNLIFAFGAVFGIALSVISQDTITDNKGNIRTGKILFYDRSYNLMSFLDGSDTIYLNLSEVIRPELNQERIGKSPYYVSKSPATKTNVQKMGIAKQPPNFVYSPYSFGINIFSLIRPTFMLDSDVDLFFSSNLNIDVFFQKEMNPNLALRFPMRIGIKPLNKEIIKSIDYYGEYIKEYGKEIIADVGFEPLFYRNGLKKATWFVAPSLCIGIGRKVVRTNNYLNYTSTYTPSGNAGYFKIGATSGFQLNLTPGIQFGMEYGAYIANNAWHFYYDNIPKRRTYLGFMGKCYISYRLGGKPRN
jgi:hypothetical protein